MENKSNSGVVYQGKIPGRVKYCFAFGALGKDLIYGMIATFSMIYFTDIIKVAPAFIGTMFFVAKLWDAFNDLFMGMIVDNTRSRWGKFVPWLVIGTLINSFVFVTVFTDFHLSGVSLCVFASVVYVLWGMTYTIMDGLELSKIIHDNYINTKIILFSGWDDFEYARTAISYGVSQYLMKPIDYDEMQKLLTNIHEELEKEYAEKLNRTRLENIYAESIPLLRQQFFTQLLTEPVTDEYYDSQIKNLKLNLNYTVFHIITVKIRTTDLIDVLSELSIKETIKEALEKISSLYEFGIIDKEVFLLCGNKKHDIERITRTIQEASVLIERIFHTRISCGISSSTTTIKELPLLYQQALEALDYNVVIQEESYTYYNDILPLQKKEEDWNSEVDSIEKIITRCSEEELKQAVITMLEHLHSSHYNLSEYQIVVLEISFSLSRLYKKYQLTSDKEFAGSKKMAVKILSLNTGEELDNWLINYFQLIRTLIQKKQVDNNVILAENAKKLVEERFQEPDLSVESICQELHVSSSYFSKIFKQETGSTFLNYLINRRMEAAKMLLDVTDYKSHVIGTMVGYPEPNYFSYVFKKHCGISPVKYRKLGGSVNEK